MQEEKKGGYALNKKEDVQTHRWEILMIPKWLTDIK